MENANWEDFNLSPPILSTIKDLGFTSLTPVQASCIPLFLSKKKDVAVEAVTGSGKTLAFLIPMFEVLLKNGPFKKYDLRKDAVCFLSLDDEHAIAFTPEKEGYALLNSSKHIEISQLYGVAAIVISPTRELAAQTYTLSEMFLKHLPQLKSILLIGGNSVSSDINNILENGANIVIATPGRLADIFTHNKSLKFAAFVKTLEMLILDEADRLLDMGFEKTLNTILGYLPKQRQTGLFSATQTKEMMDLIRAGMRNPVSISVKEKTSTSVGQRTPSTLLNFYMVCETDKKFSQLIAFLKSKEATKCMIFFSTCASVDYFSCVMKEILKNIPIISIHGKMRKKRHEIFSNFKNLESGILLCTDVMARGVDIPDVQWVIQFDPPSSASSFVHRCGRTARIGKTGNALIMLLPNEESFVNFLSINQKVDLEEMHALKTPDLSPQIRKLAIKNREIYEKGLRAFVSFIRFYTKHECTLLFRVKDLDLGKLSYGYALLKLPKMPELKNKVIKTFVPVEMNYDEIPYLDKHREKQRLLKLKEFKENPISWKTIDEKREKRIKAKKLEAKKKMAKKRRKRKALQDTAEDLEDFARDARLLKKFKKGKISKEEFDAEFAPDCEDFG